MATAFTDTLAPARGGRLYRRKENTLFGGEKVTNGLMAGGAAGVPTGWTALSTTGGTPSLLTNDARFAGGSCRELAVAAGATPSYLLQQVIGLTVGNVYDVTFRMALAGQVYGEGYPTLELERGSGVLLRGFRFQTDTAGTFAYRFTADHNTLRLNWRWQFGTMAAASALRIGEMSVRDLTILGAA